MTWLKFIGWLSGLYAFYYLFNILWDLARGRKADNPAGRVQELSFAGDFKPQQVHPEPDENEQPKLPEAAASPVIASGGVDLKGLFSLARKDAIAITGAVTF